jgi:transcriptional regulator with XRE-family HTH domain
VDIYEQIGTRLRRARLEADLTQESAEKRSRGKCKAGSISSWENGRDSISIQSLLTLAAIYEKDPCWLAFGHRDRTRIIDLSRWSDDDYELALKMVGAIRGRSTAGQRGA